MKMSTASQSTQSPVAADTEFRGVLLCVWICISLLTKELPFLSDLWHKHLKRSCDYPEGDGVVVTQYNGLSPLIDEYDKVCWLLMITVLLRTSTLISVS